MSLKDSYCNSKHIPKDQEQLKLNQISLNHCGVTKRELTPCRFSFAFTEKINGIKIKSAAFELSYGSANNLTCVITVQLSKIIFEKASGYCVN